MKNIDKIHSKAMEIAQKAFLMQQNGHQEEFVRLSKEAFLLEKEAALYLLNKKDAEPSRSILFKSAAFLAFDAKEYEECEEMMLEALLGNPDEQIKEELKELKYDLRLITHLSMIHTPNI
jgi:hypothetical protein